MTGEGILEGTTPSGIRLVTERIPDFHSVAMGVFFRQGSRDELSETLGSSHLIEHMLFKGTKKHSSKEILYEIERLGGISDGFTSKGITGLTVRCLKDSLEPLVRLLFEMLTSSTFDAKELKKEKEVIYEEMRSTQEDPQDIVFDNFFKACFSPHPLATPVVGTESTVSKISRDKLLDIYKSQYTLNDSIFVAVGNVDETQIKKALPKRPGLLKGKRKLRKPPEEKTKPESKLATRTDISQVHAVMGTQTIGINSDVRFPLALLTTLLGGGMSSRLFSLLREDKGLVYTVSSFLDLFEDCGTMGFYFITEKSKLSKVFRSIEDELSRLKKNGLRKGELDIAKTLTKSALILNMESLSHRMGRLGHWKLLAQKFRSITETIAEFEKVTEEQVLELAKSLFNSKPFHTSFVGPVSASDIKPLTRR